MSVSMRVRRPPSRTSPLQVAAAVVALVMCLVALTHFHGHGTAVAASSTPASAAYGAPAKSEVRIVRP